MRFGERSTGVQTRSTGREIASLLAVSCGLVCLHVLGSVHEHLPNDIHKRNDPPLNATIATVAAGNCIFMFDDYFFEKKKP